MTALVLPELGHSGKEYAMLKTEKTIDGDPPLKCFGDLSQRGLFLRVNGYWVIL